MRAYTGPFGGFVRADAFFRLFGPRLREMSELAVLNANYLRALLADPEIAQYLPIAFDRHCMHEFVLSGKGAKEKLGI